MYLKVPKDLEGLIFLDGLLLVHVPFVCIIKFIYFYLSIYLLAQFPVDHLSHPVVSFLVFFWCQFAAISYMVFCFVFLSPSLQTVYICYSPGSYLSYHFTSLFLRASDCTINEVIYLIIQKFSSRDF